LTLFSCSLFLGVNYTVYTPFHIISYIKRTVGALSKSAGTVISFTCCSFFCRAGKVIRKDFPIARWFAIFKWLEYYKKAFLRFWCTVPGAMKSNKGTVFIT